MWVCTKVVNSELIRIIITHDDFTRWKHFPCYWPFVGGIHRSPVNYPHKGHWRGAWVFSLICAWTDSKQWGRWWFETLVRSLGRHCNATVVCWCRQCGCVQRLILTAGRCACWPGDESICQTRCLSKLFGKIFLGRKRLYAAHGSNCKLHDWMNDWINNGEGGDLRRHRAHHDVTVMYREKRHLQLSQKSVNHFSLNHS